MRVQGMYDRACGVLGLALAVSWGGGLGAQDAMAGAMASVTLEDAIQRAVDRSPQYAQTASQLRNAESSHRTVLGDFLPSLSLSSGSSVQSSQRFDQATQRVVSGSSNSYNAGLSASYTVFQGGRRFREWDRTNAEIAAAEASLEDQRFNVVLQTQNAFYNALRQADLLEVQTSRLERAEESLGNIRRQVTLGVATRSDTLRARLEMANARQAVLVQETALRAARFALGRQIGSEVPVSPVEPDRMDPSPISLTDDEIYQIAVGASPSVRASEANVTATSASVSVGQDPVLAEHQRFIRLLLGERRGRVLRREHELERAILRQLPPVQRVQPGRPDLPGAELGARGPPPGRRRPLGGPPGGGRGALQPSGGRTGDRDRA